MLWPVSDRATTERPPLVLWPVSDRATTERPRNPRPAILAGVTIGLLDINKMQGYLFLDEMARQLSQRLFMLSIRYRIGQR